MTSRFEPPVKRRPSTKSLDIFKMTTYDAASFLEVKMARAQQQSNHISRIGLTLNKMSKIKG